MRNAVIIEAVRTPIGRAHAEKGITATCGPTICPRT